MNKLFIELYLDENVSILVAKILRSRGFRIQTTDEAGRKGSDDASQLNYAVENGMAIVTINRGDFELLAKEYFYGGKGHCGIFLINDNPPNIIAQKLSDYLDLNTADEMVDQVIYL